MKTSMQAVTNLMPSCYVFTFPAGSSLEPVGLSSFSRPALPVCCQGLHELILAQQSPGLGSGLIAFDPSGLPSRAGALVQQDTVQQVLLYRDTQSPCLLSPRMGNSVRQLLCFPGEGT